MAFSGLSPTGPGEGPANGAVCASLSSFPSFKMEMVFIVLFSDYKNDA